MYSNIVSLLIEGHSVDVAMSRDARDTRAHFFFHTLRSQLNLFFDGLSTRRYVRSKNVQARTHLMAPSASGDPRMVITE